MQGRLPSPVRSTGKEPARYHLAYVNRPDPTPSRTEKVRVGMGLRRGNIPSREMR